MQYRIEPIALSKIWSFYRNVAKKYRHVYAYDDMERNIRQAILGTRSIERTLPRRRPTLIRWQGMYMARSGQWYYAYRIDGEIITVCDACHQQNMHESE